MPHRSGALGALPRAAARAALATGWRGRGAAVPRRAAAAGWRGGPAPPVVRLEVFASPRGRSALPADFEPTNTAAAP